MLGQRFRHCPNMKTMLDRRVLLTWLYMDGNQNDMYTTISLLLNLIILTLLTLLMFLLIFVFPLFGAKSHISGHHIK